MSSLNPPVAPAPEVQRNPCYVHAPASVSPYMTRYAVNGQGWYSLPYSMLCGLRMRNPDCLTVEYANTTVTLKGRNLTVVHDALFQHRLVEATNFPETVYPFGPDDAYIGAIEIKSNPGP